MPADERRVLALPWTPVTDLCNETNYFRVKGKPAPKGRFPWMVSIKNHVRVHVCGGILIRPQHVLTAAHCVDKILGIGLNGIVHIGPYDMHDGEDIATVEVMRAEQTCIHPSWTGKTNLGGDIALLRLPRKMDSPCPTLADPKTILVPGSPVRSLGWGLTPGSTSTSLKMTTNLEVVDNEVCPGMPDLAPELICAYSKHEDSCSGDSGGPLFMPDCPNGDLGKGNPELDLIYGVVSSGKDCSRSNGTAGAYTRAYRYHDWIMGITSGKMSPEKGGCLMDVPRGTHKPAVDLPKPEYKVFYLATVVVAVLMVVLVSGDTPLHWAAERGLNQMAQFFLTKTDVDVDCPNCYGSSPLILAARHGRESTVKLLLGFHASVNKDDRMEGDFRRPRPKAAIKEAVHRLGMKGQKDGMKLYDLMCCVRARGGCLTPLIAAAEQNQKAIVELLIEFQAKVNLASESGRTAILAAAGAGHTEVAEVLLRNGANANLVHLPSSTPLVRAAMEGHAETIELLLKHNADVDKAAMGGLTPLIWAARNGHSSSVEALLNARASVDKASGVMLVALSVKDTFFITE
eukprot:evm.model.scf_693.4 EVM.evm.TU.scf_693.4   scf_693:25180-36119(-)